MSTRTLCFAFAAMILALVLAQSGLAAAEETPEAIDIGERRELFVDRHLIDEMNNTTLKLHEPVLAPAPTGDVDTLEYGTVIKDGDRYRLYTRARHESKRDGDAGEYTRYFESIDGLHWTAPSLGLFEAPGTGWGNVILHEAPLCHNFSPMLDARPGTPEEERFKALAGLTQSGLLAFASADGIHWRKLQEEPVIPASVPWEWHNLFDSQNVSFWSESEGRYVCYFRSFDKLRKIARMTSDDYRTWGEAKLLDVNGEGEHLYTSQTHPYFHAPHIYIALPTRFYPDRGSSTDILFMSTRGDALYSRPFHEAFIRPGLDPARWGNRSNYAALNVVPTGPAEMSIYTTPMRRFTLRTDGFVSVHAGDAAGEMLTKRLRFSGSALRVNYSTSAGGSLRVRILGGGTVDAGSMLAESDPLIGDAIDQPVTWTNGTDIASLADQPVRLQFELRDADLYALQFGE